MQEQSCSHVYTTYPTYDSVMWGPCKSEHSSCICSVKYITLSLTWTSFNLLSFYKNTYILPIIEISIVSDDNRAWLPGKGIRGSSYVFLNKWSIFMSHNRHYHVFRYLIRVVTDLFFNCVLSYILRLLVWSKWCGKYMDPTDSSR